MHVKLLFAMIALAIIPIIFLQSFYINYMMNHIRANRVDLRLQKRCCRPIIWKVAIQM